jgi:hypothetical protein
MTSSSAELRSSPGSGGASFVQAVTVIMGIVVSLTFMFGYGNVLNLALRLGVPVWVAPLVAPAVDLSILGLILGIRQLALTGATPAQLRPARRLLIFASTVTLALNVADPLGAGQYGKAAFDAVGPLLLIGWAEVGPDLMRALTRADRSNEATSDDAKRTNIPFADEPIGVGRRRRSSPGRARSQRPLHRTGRAALRLPSRSMMICLSGRGPRTRAIGTSIADRSPQTPFAGSSVSAPAPGCS